MYVKPTKFQHGVQGLYKSCVIGQTPGLAISSTKTLAKTSNTFAIRFAPLSGGPAVFSAPQTTADCPAFTTSAAAATPIADGFSRIYTLLASVSSTTGGATYSWANSLDIDTHRGPLNEKDFNMGDLKHAIIGTVYIKWEPNDGTTWTPGTDNLDKSGATVIYTDCFGWVVA